MDFPVRIRVWCACCLYADLLSHLWSSTGSVMSSTAAVRGLTVLFLSVSVVQGQDGWTMTYFPRQVCAAKGSIVDISCTYIFPPRVDGEENKLSQTFWFPGKEGYTTDIEKSSNYSGRVKKTCVRSKCFLKITNLRETDSDEYFFRIITNKNRYFGQPGVTLNVTGLEVLVQKQQTGLLFKCFSSCPKETSYVWFKNGQKIKDKILQNYSPGQVLHTDRYSCAVRGYEKFLSPPVYSPGLPSVSMSPSAEIQEGSSVTLTCSSDAKPAANYTWYKKDENPDPQPPGEGPQIVFSSIQPSDSGEYYCEAENELGKTRSGPVSVRVKSAVSENSTLLVVVGVTAVALLVVLSLSVFLWMRKKRASSESPEAEERPNNTKQLDQKQPEEQNNLQYATIHFSKNQADLYSNITPARPVRHTEQQDISEYAVVKHGGTSSAPRTNQDTGKDADELYSTVKTE